VDELRPGDDRARPGRQARWQSRRERGGRKRARVAEREGHGPAGIAGNGEPCRVAAVDPFRKYLN